MDGVYLTLKKNKFRFLKKLFEYCLILGLLLFGSNLIMTFIFASEKIQGQSMEPNFSDDDRVLSIRIKPLRRGDIVIFESPKDPDKFYVKRVIGMPGDTVEYKNDQLYINGQIQKEKYLKQFHESNQDNSKKSSLLTKDFTLKKILNKDRVPPNSYFVLGDNRIVSEDSRNYGFVKRSSIIGIVFIRYWPIGQFSFF